VPVRTKSSRDAANAFEKILIDGTPNMVQSDKGTEFLNTTFQSMLKLRGIKFYTSENAGTQRGREIQQDVENENVSLFHLQEY